MKILVLGSGGIVGQHLKTTQPEEVTAVYSRRSGPGGVDLLDVFARTALLDAVRPDVIINLAGEARVDEVEKDPAAFAEINTRVPWLLAQRCLRDNTYLVQVSSQAVFDGHAPPYSRDSPCFPINEYGKQKAMAEGLVRESLAAHCIARLTFCLGVRISTTAGRQNPLEHMLLMSTQRQVDDRWFSVSFARDAARVLWKLAMERTPNRIEHIGYPVRMSRYSLAKLVCTKLARPTEIIPVKHDMAYPDLAPRPLDTTWAYGSLSIDSWTRSLWLAIKDYRRQHVPAGND